MPHTASISASDVASLDLLRVEEAASLLNVQPATVRSWLLRGRLPRVQLSPRSIRIRRQDLENIVRRGFIPARESR